jgi:Putative addiction module component
MLPEDVFSTALALPLPKRAELAHALLVSLHEQDAEPAAEVEAAWLVEIEKRARAVADGTATLVDWEEARGRIEARLRERRAARAGR